MKKIIGIIASSVALLIALLSFSGCGGSESGSDTKPKTKTAAIKIDDIAWSVDSGIVDGERTVLLEYTNNSKYTVVEFELQFKQKSDITEDEKTKYFDDMKKRLDVDESDPDEVEDFEELKTKEITMCAESGKVAKSGETVSGTKCKYYNGYYVVKNIEHYSLVEPDILTLRYIDGDKIFKVYYDFLSKKYTTESETEPAYYWTENEIGSVIPKPVSEYVEEGSDCDDYFSFDVHGWSIDDYNAYVKQCKETGFTVDVREHDGFYAADSNTGYQIYTSYNSDECTADISVKPVEK